jgi:hypothetical protein
MNEMPSATARQPLSDDALRELLSLLQGADSVELKLTVPESDQRSAVQGLGMDPLDAQIRQVFFFDTPDLALDRHGLVVRARRVQKKGDDSVVKLRPVVPKDIPPAVRTSPNFGIEVDAMPGGFVCSGSMKRALPRPVVKEAIAGQLPLRKLFSKEQRAFFSEHAPDGVQLDDLAVLGPIFVLKLRFTPKGYDRRLVAEMWLFPDNSRILELSTKCLPPEAFETAAGARVFLADNGIDLSGEQAAKTKKALRYFSKNLLSNAQ